jgi:hypothetical protein
MARNHFAPPVARLEEEPTSRFLLPMLASLLAGVASWVLALKASGWAFPNLWRPLAEIGYSTPTILRVIVPFIVVPAAFVAAISLLRARPWWAPWPAFLLGIVLCVIGRVLVFSQGMAFAFGIFQREIFWAAVLASSLLFLLFTRAKRARSNKSLERTRGR